MKRGKINPISHKRQSQLPEYIQLIKRLRELCENKSELSGANPDFWSNFHIEPHHIDGRDGKRLLNPFGIIMLTREEHMIEQGQMKGNRVGKEKLFEIVKELRLRQGFVQDN